MVDCFVSSFRINYRNSQHFDDCLSPTTPVIFSVVYVKGLYTIVRQVKSTELPKVAALFLPRSSMCASWGLLWEARVKHAVSAWCDTTVKGLTEPGVWCCMSVKFLRVFLGALRFQFIIQHTQRGPQEFVF